MNEIKLEGRRWKLFLVDPEDENRERVVSGIVDVAQIDYQVDHDTIRVDSLLDSAKIFMTEHRATMKLNCVPGPNGELFRMENFLEEDEDEEDFE